MSILSTIFPLLEESNSTESIEIDDDGLKIPSDTFELLINSSSSSISSESGGGEWMQLPKVAQAVITLFVCALLLVGTLGIIQQIKIWCGIEDEILKREAMELAVPQTSRDYESGAGGGSADRLRANLNDAENPRNSGAFSKNFMHYQPSSRPQTPQNIPEPVPEPPQEPVKPKGILVKQQSSAKEAFVRRTSGPFGDDTIDFYGESYNKRLAKHTKQRGLEREPSPMFKAKSISTTAPAPENK